MRLLMGLSLAAAALLIDAGGAAHAQSWCSFEPDKESRLACGYSDIDKCLEHVGRAGGICVPDPDYAGLRTRSRISVASATVRPVRY